MALEAHVLHPLAPHLASSVSACRAASSRTCWCICKCKRFTFQVGYLRMLLCAVAVARRIIELSILDKS